MSRSPFPITPISGCLSFRIGTPHIVKVFSVLTTFVLAVGVVAKTSCAQSRITLPGPQSSDGGKRVIKLPGPQRSERAENTGVARQRTVEAGRVVEATAATEKKPCNACARLKELERKQEIDKKLRDLGNLINEPTGLGNLNTGQASLAAQVTEANDIEAIVVVTWSVLFILVVLGAYVFNRSRGNRQYTVRFSEAKDPLKSSDEAVDRLNRCINQLSIRMMEKAPQQQMVVLGGNPMPTNLESLARQWNQDLVLQDIRALVRDRPPVVPYFIDSVPV
jgi:hypothetical protein